MSVKLTIFICSVVAIAWMLSGIEIGTKIEKRKYSNKLVFCQDCCWKNEFDGRAYYTCAETKEELWRKIP